MSNDPFANAPAPDPAPEGEAQDSGFDAPPAEAPKKAAKKAAPKAASNAAPVVNVGADGKHVVTLKGGAGFDAPWYVIHAKDLDEVEELFAGEDAGRLLAVMGRIQNAAQAFVKLGPAKEARQGGNGGGGGGGRSNAPRGAQEPPSWFPPSPGEGWQYRSGQKKDGSGLYHAWAPPRGSNEKWQFHNPPK